MDIKASLKDDPSFKRLLQKSLKGHAARIVKEAHGFAEEVVGLIRDKTQNPDKKIVVLVDSVEKLRGIGADGADEVYKSAVNLFSSHADSLRIPMLHVVYTIPPYLTPLASNLGKLFGAMQCALPAVHVQTKTNQRDDDGLAIMREFVRLRCAGDLGLFFTDAQLNELAQASGGDVRDFFCLVRDSLVKTSARGDFPVTDAIIERTKNHSRREMLPIARDDKQWLLKIHESKKAELESIEKLPTLARFFDSKLVLNYRNGDDWYDVHPLLRDEIKA